MCDVWRIKEKRKVEKRRAWPGIHQCINPSYFFMCVWEKGEEGQ